jgi:hypothetical protein
MIIPRHRICNFCGKKVGVNKRYFKIKSKDIITCYNYGETISSNINYDICIDCMQEFATYLHSKLKDKEETPDENRMVYVQETVNTILNSHTDNTDIDKAFRNAAKLVQNAIDGEPVDFEEIERSEKE